MKSINENYKEPNYSDVIIESEDDEFEINPIGIHPPKRLECKLCGSKRWIVGEAQYFTAIKCPNCGYELCIHSG